MAENSGEGAAFVAGGAAAGAGVSATVGGMGLAIGGTAVGIGMAPVAAAGAVVGHAAYGIAKLLDEAGTGETAAQVFTRMEEKVLEMEAYSQALAELADLGINDLEQKFAALEIDAELEALKAQLQTGTNRAKLPPS